MSALCIGLTGGIATGKSFIAERFEALGVPMLEADVVAREVVEAGTPALRAIAAEFGPQFLLPDGTLDRRRMRTHVFSDDGARQRLEAITHPAIHERVQGWRERQTAPWCLYSTAILVETDMTARVDRVLVVDAPVEVQLQRLVTRDRHDAALARDMIAAQAPRDTRLAAAHDIIDNRAGDATVLPQIRRLHRLYTYLASTRARS